MRKYKMGVRTIKEIKYVNRELFQGEEELIDIDEGYLLPIIKKGILNRTEFVVLPNSLLTDTPYADIQKYIKLEDAVKNGLVEDELVPYTDSCNRSLFVRKIGGMNAFCE